MKLLEEQANLSQSEIREQYVKFKGVTSGGETITRDIFSQIMHKCYPRTYKVNNQDNLRGEEVTIQLCNQCETAMSILLISLGLKIITDYLYGWLLPTDPMVDCSIPIGKTE